MKILLGNFSLADGGYTSSPEGLRINGRYEVQSAAFLRGAAVSICARGNQVNTITFACTREHATYAAATAFLFTHAATMPTDGALTITTEQWEGTVISFKAVASAVSARAGSQAGITTRHEYTVLCGALTGGSLALDPLNPTAGGGLTTY